MQLLLSFIALCLYNWQCNKCNQSQIRAPSHARMMTTPFVVLITEKKVPHLRIHLPALLIIDSFHYFRLYFSHLLYIIWFPFLLVSPCFSSNNFVTQYQYFYHVENWHDFPEQYASCLKICAVDKMLVTVSMYQFFFHIAVNVLVNLIQNVYF